MNATAPESRTAQPAAQLAAPSEARNASAALAGPTDAPAVPAGPAGPTDAPAAPTDAPVVPAGRIVLSLVLRTALFLLFGLLIAGLFALLGSEHPLQAAERWWPYQAILANAATFFALRALLRKEGGSYRGLLGFRGERPGRFLKQFLWLIPVGFLLGGIPLYLFSYLILGSATPPELMFQPLPLWAAIVAAVVFPLANGLVETPVYIGYAMPRLKAAAGMLLPAVVLAGLALAFQHVALPVVADVPYMLWRFASFVPLAIALGWIYNRTRRLLPIAAAHTLMDLQLALTLLAYSV